LSFSLAYLQYFKTTFLWKFRYLLYAYCKILSNLILKQSFKNVYGRP
jgi:hypothetical protein